MFSRTDRSRKSASARLPGTKVSPAAIASAGWEKRTGAPSISIRPASGLRRPASASKSSSCPWPFQRHDAQHLAGMKRQGHVDELRRDGEALDPTGAGGRSGPRPRRPGTAPAEVDPAPSIISTSRSSTPGAIATSPTVRPSRRTLARSQRCAISAKRCEM
jgi:hypothetical protein